MISIQQVTYTYPGTNAPALKDISLAIPAGQFCAVIGGNGAGKSTLAYTIAGFVPHFYHGELRGEVSVAGKKTSSSPMHDLVSSVGLVFQNPFNQISGTKFTVREEIAFGMENLGIPRDEMLARCEAMMALVGISELAERFPLSLSGGQMQRVVLACILAMQPEILVLDEPTSQLDPIGSREVLAAIRQLALQHQMTVLIIEHKLEWLAAFADRLVAMAEGAIIADGLPRDVLSNETVWERGVGMTRYTMAARQIKENGRWPADLKLPVTLEEAMQGFQAVKQ
jgi:energy-coupling factor transporter ATP-binding protein EcfA2